MPPGIHFRVLRNYQNIIIAQSQSYVILHSNIALYEGFLKVAIAAVLKRDFRLEDIKTFKSQAHPSRVKTIQEVDNIPATVVAGQQWGDEGKGKLVDIISEQADMTVRYQGGNNAGHTVVIEGKEYKLHLLPSAILRKQRCLIASGVVLNPEVLKQEIKNLDFEPNLGIDYRTQIIMPYHIAMDLAKERKRNKDAIGTTLKGIGPCYSDRADRSGIRFFDLVEGGKGLEKKIRDNFRIKKKIIEKVFGFNMEVPDGDGFRRLKEKDVVEEYVELGQNLKNHLCDVSSEVQASLKRNDNVLFEGAQGALLDIAHGTYPNVTSSHPLAGEIFTSVGIPPEEINIIGIVKAYTTRVGGGPFVTELHGKMAEDLREKGKEYGTTTGRPRRVGWLDFVALRYAIEMSGVDQIALTKLDVLAGMETIKMCCGYHGATFSPLRFPAWDDAALRRARPTYEEMPGFEEVVDSNGHLDSVAGEYVNRISEVLNVPVTVVSIGADRKETIFARYFKAFKGKSK